ncbi:hypothetical protein [Marinimicrobium sp. ABcell2]|uniref:hypothetical protein n=1 Tax=Marinimicrobium sp. ABcell2 TaxID=3069751 RepID=UPI0027B7C819|nr:hypothetical protein [Marinimicrobium sp. ABcell2]MDQ2077458.1 hypothetical protein [Marinimicrobium sp. ABcell2]
MSANNPTTFGTLIALTKRIEALEAQDQSPADFLDELAQLSRACQELFKEAKPGEDIYLVQGRTSGDDTDSVDLLFAPNGGAAINSFVENTLFEDPAHLRIINDPRIHIDMSVSASFMLTPSNG